MNYVRAKMVSHVPQILAALKREFRSQNLTYREIGELCEVSEVSIKRYMSGHALTLDVLEKLCDAAGLDLYDLMEAAKRDEGATARPFNAEQEALLLREPFVQIIYFLFNWGWTVDEVVKEFKLGEAELNRYLTALDSLELIKLYPKNRIKVIAGSTAERRSPLRRQFSAIGVQKDFCNFDSGSEEVNWRFMYFKLSEKSLESLRAVTDKYRAAVIEVIKNAHKADHTSGKWYALLNVFRPFDVSKYRFTNSR